MRDYLLDLVSHTYDLGCITSIKITGSDNETKLQGVDYVDKTVVINGRFHAPIADFVGVFGMPNLDKLKILLNLPEYREDATITVTKEDREQNGKLTLTGLHFANTARDFTNNYRFMTEAVANQTMKDATFVGAKWDVEFEPLVASIQRLKSQSQAHSDVKFFNVVLDGSNLKLTFGDPSSHAGEFVFQSGITTKFNRNWSYPVSTVISILNLAGNKTMRISGSNGAMNITVDSGLAVYDYIVPAQTK